jgi:hypothetical protein
MEGQPSKVTVPEPLVRARHLKSVLAEVDRQPQRQAIRDRIGPAVLADIEEATGTDWLPVVYDVAMANALELVLGREGLATFNRALMLQSLRGPLLRALVELATRMLGLDAGAWASWIPRGWPLMFQGFGRWTVVRHGEGEVTLTLTGLPPVCSADAVWPRSVASTLSGILPAVGAAGTVTLDSADPATGTLVYTMRWQAGRPTGSGT